MTEHNRSGYREIKAFEEEVVAWQQSHADLDIMNAKLCENIASVDRLTNEEDTLSRELETSWRQIANVAAERNGMLCQYCQLSLGLAHVRRLPLIRIGCGLSLLFL